MKTANVLLLDVDGVLVTAARPFSLGVTRLKSAADLWKLNARRKEATAFFTGSFLTALIGQADLKELLAPWMARLDLPGTPDTLMAEWFAAENVPNLPLLEAVGALRAAGWASSLATNQEKHRLHYLLHDMRLGDLMDGEYASCTVGARKPDAAYFERVSADLNRQRPGLAPASIVFWDDAQANVTAAQAAGWTAFLYTTPEDFQKQMAALG